MNTLTHSQPALTRPAIVQINLDISLVFWPLYAAVWLGWLILASLGRFIRKFLYDEYPRAVIVVSGRRLRRWLRGNERRFSWEYSRWVYGPVMGGG